MASSSGAFRSIAITLTRTVDPALVRRDLYHFGLVENIGERG